MTTYESKVTHLHSPIEQAYATLSDLRNLEQFKDRLPSDKIQDISFTEDACHFTISPIGRVALVIVDREPNKTIKFAAENIPTEFNLWIQLLPTDTASKMKITIKIDIPIFLKPMIGNRIQEVVDTMALAISQTL